MKTIAQSGLSALPQVAQLLLDEGAEKNLWVFEGEVGAGKTTLIKAICKALGVESEVSSPTFSLVNEYHSSDGRIIFHFDFYRINNMEEVFDIGYEDYFYSGNLCLIEWPDKIAGLLEDEEVFRIVISGEGDERKVEAEQ